jgi:dTDP-4-dehydrorhamnose reductase
MNFVDTALRPKFVESDDAILGAASRTAMPALELWGGAECTVNRVGDRYRDQLAETGHDRRLEDIDLIAGLGIKSLRFPILWERVAPEEKGEYRWEWSDARVARLRKLGIEPIAGLVHHGSGPRHTSLLDDAFPEKLAAYALAVAQRYPHIRDWTPVNEPLTTARFSALYGHWYPHRRDEQAFWTALINQIDGVRLAMRAIRSVNPGARLIQTDDLGMTYSTGPLARRARHYNERRWVGWDLLFGRVTSGHPLRERIERHGLGARLDMLADDPCPPDIIGVNHYLTSDRFLDHRMERYPGYGSDWAEPPRFADVEAVRVLDPYPDGWRAALRAAWGRYRTPLAMTEVHNGCTRDEQFRWLRDSWQSAEALRGEGIPIVGFTAWALFGNKGWNTLLTAEGEYEPGIFDARSGTPRPTALAPLLRNLDRKSAIHPCAGDGGWWRRDVRFEHPVVKPRGQGRIAGRTKSGDAGHPVMILGATGTLGQALYRTCQLRNIAAVLTARSDCDLSDEGAIAAALDRLQPSAVINAAGWVRVDDAEVETDACHLANAKGAIALAQACAERGISTLSFSSDLVFGDDIEGPRDESCAVNPLNVYGASKAAMEQAIGALEGRHLVARTAAFFSPHDAHNFAVHVVRTLSRGERFAAAADRVVTLTYVPHLCDAALDLMLDGEDGVWHLSNGKPLSWAEFAVQVAMACGLKPSLIDALPAEAMGWRAARPRNCALISERGAPMPSFDTALTQFARKMAI